MNYLSCLFCILIAGCATKPQPVFKPVLPDQKIIIDMIPQKSTRAKTQVAALEAPTKLMGPEWTHAVNFDPLTQFYEVWSTTNLARPFTLLGTTTGTNYFHTALPAEFFMVRTADIYGQKSVWATTR
jgi:hypothetical protein